MLANLRSLRETSGLSQRQLAEILPKELNLTQQKVQAYEAGAYEPSISTLTAMANFFGTTIDYLVGNSALCFG